MLTGFGGHLVSEQVLEQHLDRHTGAQMPSPVRGALARWLVSQRLLGPASSVRTMLEAGAEPLMVLLGFQQLDALVVDAETCVATLRGASTPVALLVSRWGERLDPFWRRATVEAASRAAAWCVLFNGTHVRLVHTVRVLSRRFLEFDVEALDDERAAAAVWLLFSAAALEPGLGRPSTAGAIVEESERHATGVCRALRHGVLQASGDVLRALVAHRTRASLDDAFDQALTVVYRMLFLLFAEARALVPSWHPVYRDSYSLETLRNDAMRGSQTGLWDALRAIARLAHGGCVAGDLRVTPFNGRLFAPARTPLADRPGLDDEAARRSLVALSTRPAPDGEGREPVAYRDLGVEQLGAVYETLLDYRPRVVPGRQEFRTHREVALVAGSGVRKATGTFYTPQSIATFLIRQTLAPIVEGRTPAQILDLKVLDPSMGSGAFLVGACGYLADAYETALVSSGACHAADIDPRERARIKRTVAERCLYGVDLNPMAVQLARLSLWLATLAHDRPLSFLDHHLVAGDSVLGTWVSCLRRAPSGSRHRSGPLPLFEEERLSHTLKDILPVRFQLGRDPNDTPGQVRAKERALASLNSDDTPLAKWKRVADLWCARWFDTGLRTPVLFAPLSDAILSRHCELPRSTADPLLRTSADIARTRRFFHWELEFPEVFFDPAGTRRADGGFDAVIGNPPWDMLRADAGRRNDSEEGERRARRAREGAARGKGVPASDRAGVWGGAPRNDARDIVRFTRDSGVYAAQSDGHANSYQLFLERAIALTRAGGRLGLVLPAGLVSDHGSAALRRLLFSQCAVDGFVGFDNRRRIFPIHRSVRFLLLSATHGAATTSIGCRLGETDPAIVDAAERTFPYTLRLTPELIEKISGGDLAIPDLRTPIDLAVAERAAELFRPLGDQSGWNACFGRELNATEDRAAFGPQGRGLPVVEGKMIDPFRVDTRRARHSLPVLEASRRLGGRHHRARLAYRDVASATNRVTLIAAILPAASVSTHTVLCLKTPLAARAQWYLCGMFNSLVVNYLARMRVTTHVTTAIVERLPVPREDQAGSAFREIAAIARVLSRRHEVKHWARLNATVAGLYQLDDDELAHVLGTFPLLDAADRAEVLRVYERIR